MAEEKHQLKVFLCHAHSDKGKVRELYLRLKTNGVDAWLDKEKLLPGQDWELEIRKAVREADVVVVCLSKDFNQAGFRQKEVRLALDTAMEKPEGEIFIIPARLEECDTLESLRKWHWVDLFDGDGYEKLMRTLRVRAETVGLTLQVKRNWLPKVSKSSVSTEKTPSHTKLSNAKSVPFQVEEKKDLTSQPNNEHSKPPGLKKQRKPNIAIIVAVIGFVGTIIAGLLGSPLIKRWFSPAPVPTVIPSLPIITPTPAKTQIPLDPEITDDFGVEMVLVPEGKFIMGSDVGEENEKLVHEVNLHDYYIDKYEVTNALYQECVNDGVCIEPSERIFEENFSYYGIDDYSNYPVVYVTWDMAFSFCEWRGLNLPDEEMWEKAASWDDALQKKYVYPWGDIFDGNKANFCDFNCTFPERNAEFNDYNRFTSKVGYYFPDGASPYGAFDMAGNVWEWVAGEYRGPYSYQNQDFFTISSKYGEEAPEPVHIVRGGSWESSDIHLRSTFRYTVDLDFSSSYIGFRCSGIVKP